MSTNGTGTNGTTTSSGGTSSGGTSTIGAVGVGGAVEVHHEVLEVRQDALSELAEQAVALSRSLAGPLRRIALSRGEVTVEVDWQEAAAAPVAPAAPVAAVHAAAAPVPATAVAAPAEAGEAGAATHTVRAPLVGTFYTSPSPEEPPFVSTGDTVAVGQTLGIVEAMKLMNTIVSDVAGRVVEVVAGNGSPVEFDQPLVRIEPADAALAG
ncbi:acetyl-CoA carboxylase biotin carboxyl carrier protein [Kineococcus indalonis]|uniref:acetyl-CoA carboxylase biotin carboxyl carrier protein n=1 Tax=Kineococcus indalonis TaxID=2696566 RepID=UPI001411D9B1|nr:acetyl-CoA carboxylase biotin carboxyl carrier protein [Kineococcus indalonis]NAZ84798.1 acetyl-CoA carboxylase biotin carboxyl carrier protein [Kineococcus indalonis]